MPLPIQNQGVSNPEFSNDLSNPEPNDQMTPGLAQGLSPGVAPFPASAGPQVTGPTAPTTPAAPNPQHAVGRAFGKILSGLSGGHDEYTVDPQTGQTIATHVKDSPGQTFKSILALGLMGGQGIGPKEGEYTFTQGLLAGLGGGVKEAQQRQDFLDKQRREQAQQQYANQLRAAQEERENKKLSMEQQLNQVAIADHNQNIAYRKQVMDEQAYTFAKQKGMDAAEPLRQNSLMLTEADKPKVEAYKSLQVDPVAAGLTAEEVTKYLQDHPGAASKEMGLHTGTRMVLQPDGTYKVQDLYSVYPAMNKVPPSLLQELKADGADNPKSTLHAAYKELSAAGEGNFDTRKLLPIFRDMQSWEGLQEASLSRRVKESEIIKNEMERNEGYLRMRMEKLGLKEKEDQMLAENLFRQFYDVGTNSLNPNTLDVLQAGKPDPITRQGTLTAAQAQQYKDLLQMAVVGQYEATTKDFYDHYKPTKDAFGNYVVDDAQAGPQMGFMNGLKNAQNTLAGRQAPANAPTPKVSMVTQGVTQGATREQALQALARIPTAQEDPNLGLTDQERAAAKNTIETHYQNIEAQKSRGQAEWGQEHPVRSSILQLNPSLAPIIGPPKQ